MKRRDAKSAEERGGSSFLRFALLCALCVFALNLPVPGGGETLDGSRLTVVNAPIARARLGISNEWVIALGTNSVYVGVGSGLTVTTNVTSSNVTYTVSSSAGGTNTFWMTNGVAVGAGSAGTVNWTTGVTGYLAGAVANLGVNVTGTGGSTQFVTTAHGTLTASNSIYFPNDASGFPARLGPWGAGVAFTNSTSPLLYLNFEELKLQVGSRTADGFITLGDSTANTVRELLFLSSSELTVGETAIPIFLVGNTNSQVGSSGKRFGPSWWGPYGIFSGALSLTNNPGVGNPYLEWRDTNANGYTRVQRTNNAGIFDTNVWWMSFANPSAGQVRKIHSVTWDAAGVAHIVETNAADLTGGAGSLLFNVNQFSASSTHTNIKDGALFTNAVNYAMTNNGAFSNSGPAFLGGFLDAKGPNTNRTQLNLPHLTVSRSAVINAQGDLTNSSAASNWSLYDTNLLFGAAGNSGEVQFNQSGALAATNRFMYDRANNRLISSNNNFDAAIAVTSPNLGYSNYMYADGLSTPLATYNIHLVDTAGHAISPNYWRLSTTELYYNPGSNTVDLGLHNHPWKTNYGRWFRAYEGLQITSESAATNSVTFKVTNAVRTTNIFVFSITNPVAGQVFKLGSVQNLTGGEVVSTITNDTDLTGGAGSSLFNVNQFSASSTHTNIKANALLTNLIVYASDTNQTNLVIQQAIGQLHPVFALRDSNNAPTVQLDHRGFLWMTNGLTNLSRGSTLPVSNNNIAIGATFHGGLSVPTWTDDRARTFSLGPNVFQEDVYYIAPGSGTAVFNHGGTSANAGGTTISHEAPDERKPYMVKVASAATSNSTAGISHNVNLWNSGAHNGSSRVGGAFFFSRWMITNNIAGIVGGGAPRFFVGLAGAASPNLTNIVQTTNATGQYLGLMGDPKQSLNMFITCRDASAEFRTNTGINFVATNLYELALEEAHTNRFVRWSLRDLTSRLEAFGIFSNNVPTNFMKMTILCKNGTNRANEIYFSKLYLNPSQSPRWN